MGEKGTHLELVSLIVDDYDEAIDFFTRVLGFDLVEGSPAVSTHHGHAKRWVVVRPPDARTGLLLALADGPRQEAAVGDQHGGRVGFFLRVDDFTTHHERLRAAGVTFLGRPRSEPYGQVAVFLDVAGNRWDLLGPRPSLPAGPGNRQGADGQLDVVLSQERELLGSECRRDPDRLRALLHPDFLEYGAAGTTWTRDQVLERLPGDPELPATATGFRAHRLGPVVVLVTFDLHRHDGATSHRSSTWLRGPDGSWRLRFHQGTPTGQP